MDQLKKNTAAAMTGFGAVAYLGSKAKDASPLLFFGLAGLGATTGVQIVASKVAYATTKTIEYLSKNRNQSTDGQGETQSESGEDAIEHSDFNNDNIDHEMQIEAENLKAGTALLLLQQNHHRSLTSSGAQGTGPTPEEKAWSYPRDIVVPPRFIAPVSVQMLKDPPGFYSQGKTPAVVAIQPEDPEDLLHRNASVAVAPDMVAAAGKTKLKDAPLYFLNQGLGKDIRGPDATSVGHSSKPPSFDLLSREQDLKAPNLRQSISMAPSAMFRGPPKHQSVTMAASDAEGSAETTVVTTNSNSFAARPPTKPFLDYESSSNDGEDEGAKADTEELIEGADSKQAAKSCAKKAAASKGQEIDNGVKPKCKHSKSEDVAQGDDCDDTEVIVAKGNKSPVVSTGKARSPRIEELFHQAKERIREHPRHDKALKASVLGFAYRHDLECWWPAVKYECTASFVYHHAELLLSDQTKLELLQQFLKDYQDGPTMIPRLLGYSTLWTCRMVGEFDAFNIHSGNTDLFADDMQKQAYQQAQDMWHILHMMKREAAPPSPVMVKKSKKKRSSLASSSASKPESRPKKLSKKTSSS